MSFHKSKRMVKTLSKEDIHDALDQYGAEKTDHLLMTGDDEEGARIQGNTQSAMFYVDKTARFTLQEEWDHLFKRPNFLEQLKQAALGGNLGTKNLRSICWRLFWECLSDDPDLWPGEVSRQRDVYKEIRQKYVIDPYDDHHQDDMDLSEHHPLSLAEDSAWNKYFQDNELRSTITQDLDRLCPEVEYFKKDHIKYKHLKYLVYVTFSRKKELHKTFDVKNQGMHEILANLVYAMLVSCIAVKDSKEPLSQAILTVVDMDYIEHDSYALFCHVMETLEPWFSHNLPGNNNATQNQHQNNEKESSQDVDVKNQGKGTSQDVDVKNQMPNDRRMFRNPQESQLVTAISKKLNRLQNFMLKRYDTALYEHLYKIDITPQLYGIRWIRLLFGREFSLPRVLLLWDALFADGINLVLVDYIFLSMLINLRAVLLQNDFNSCLTYLMKYPPNTDTKYILKRAIALKQNKPGASPNVPSSTSSSSTTIKTAARSSDLHHQRPHLQTNHQQRSNSPRPPPHPVRNRLGESKEQKYAHALGSGSDNEVEKKKTGSFTVVPKVSDKSQFYAKLSDEQDGYLDDRQGKFTESTSHQHQQQAGTSPERRTSVASQISNLKSKVQHSPQQIMNRISKTIKPGNDAVNTIMEDHTRLQKQVGELQSELDKVQSLCTYCGDKLDRYLILLQERLLSSEDFSDEVAILSLAGLKQVRDIFKNGAEYRTSTSDYDIDFNDIDNHIDEASTRTELSTTLEYENTTSNQQELAHRNHNKKYENIAQIDPLEAADFNYFDTEKQPDSDDFVEEKHNGSDDVSSHHDGLAPLSSSDVESPDKQRKEYLPKELVGELHTVNANRDSVENLTTSSSHRGSSGGDPLSGFLLD